MRNLQAREQKKCKSRQKDAEPPLSHLHEFLGIHSQIILAVE